MYHILCVDKYLWNSECDVQILRTHLSNSTSWVTSPTRLLNLFDTWIHRQYIRKLLWTIYLDIYKHIKCVNMHRHCTDIARTLHGHGTDTARTCVDVHGHACTWHGRARSLHGHARTLHGHACTSQMTNKYNIIHGYVVVPCVTVHLRKYFLLSLWMFCLTVYYF